MLENLELKYSAVIPYRKINGKVEVLLITSIKKKNWIIPKGYIEFNFTPFESAKKEAYEEAGIIGSNETINLGELKYEKKGNYYCLQVFLMEVKKELAEYPEMNLRKRRWFKLDEAIEIIKPKELANMLKELKKF